MTGGPIDRRAFLNRAGLATLGLMAAGCGAGNKTPPTGTRPKPRHPGAPLPRRLKDAIRGPVIERGSPGYPAAAHVFNERFDAVRPRAIAQPLDSQDVKDAIRWSVAYGVPLVARSGGHSYAGYSTVADGVVLDLGLMRSIEVGQRGARATIGAGAQLIDVYAALAVTDTTLPAGSCPTVGIAGHALGGGLGLAGRAFGLVSDNLVAARIVTADGMIRAVDKRSEPNLFWALRGGGGGNFGVVTQLTFSTHRTPVSAAWFVVSFPWAHAADVLEEWQTWAPNARDELTSILRLEAGRGTTSINVIGQYLGPAADLPGLLAALTRIPGAIVSSGDQDYLGLQMRWANCLHQPLVSCHTQGTRRGATVQRASFAAKSDYVTRPLQAQARGQLVAAVAARAVQPGSGGAQLSSYGGRINRVAPDVTAFIHRESLFSIQYLSYGGGDAWLKSTHDAMRPHVSGYAYQNYIDPGLLDWRHAYYGANYPRLVAVQERIDPDHHFYFPQAIGT